jgi:ubiquinone/menaquinone biosynthesis C-methylase UbiE
MNARWCIIAMTACLFAASPLGAQDMHKQDMHKHGGHHPRFDDPKKWSASFDDPERDKWQMPDRIVAALALRPTDVVADIGAGTGYMAVRFARALKDGSVIAVDIEPNMVKHMAERAKEAGIENLRPIVGSESAPNLHEAVDVAFLLNVYHHIDRRLDYFKRLRASLKPGARVAIVDFRPDAPAGAPKHMRISAERITEEMKAAGYKPAGSFDFLPRQNFLIFQPAE